MKRVLAIYYSQTGQLERAIRSMLSPLDENKDVTIDWKRIEPEPPYPFPWSILKFFDVFPESVQLVPPVIKDMGIHPDAHYDLAVIGYQVWFLSPALPITGFLKSDSAKILKGVPVITLIACRNMWLTAHERVKEMLRDAGAFLTDNVVLIDSAPPWSTFITTPLWLLTGKRERFLGIFPKAGVSEEDINNASRFGRAIAESLKKGDSKLPMDRPLLWGLGAVKVNPRYIASERTAYRSFRIWSKLMRLAGKPGALIRKLIISIYIVFLLTMICAVVPVMIFLRLLISPFRKESIAKLVTELEKPSGSSTERNSEYL